MKFKNFQRYSNIKYVNKPKICILRLIKKDRLLKIIEKYQNHLSIKLIKAERKSQTF